MFRAGAKLVDGSRRETERLLAEQFPKLQPSADRVKPLSDGCTLMQIVFTKEEREIFEAYRAEISHANPENRLAAVVMHAIKNARPKPQRPKSVAPARKGRGYTSVHVERAVYARAQHQCQYVSPEGRRCSQTHHLQMDFFH